MRNLLDGYKTYTTPGKLQKSVAEESQLGNVGTSVTVTVTVSWSVTWSWSVG